MKLSEYLWHLRFLLERRNEPLDPSFVELGELANLFEEHGVDGLGALRIKLDQAAHLEAVRSALEALELEVVPHVEKRDHLELEPFDLEAARPDPLEPEASG